MAETRVEPGIYRTRRGWHVYVRVAGRLHSRRLPDWPLEQVRTFRDELVTFLQAQRPPAPEPGTFAADAARYLQAVAAMPTITWRRADIALWVAEFGHRPRSSITTTDIDIVLHRWLTEGYAPSTVRKRRTALMHLYTRLDGKGASNPVRDAYLPEEPEPEARGLPYSMIRMILRAMRPSKTRARLAVMAWTGLAQSQIAALRPEDIDWQGRTVWVRARRKGRRAKGFTKPLTDEGLAALRAFAAWDAWGTFSRDSLKASFRRACATLWLGGLRPYDLRHAYGSAIYEASGDIKATQEAMGHADIRMTMRYARRAVAPRLQAAITAFAQHTGQPGRKLPAEVTGPSEPPES